MRLDVSREARFLGSRLKILKYLLIPEIRYRFPGGSVEMIEDSRDSRPLRTRHCLLLELNTTSKMEKEITITQLMIPRIKNFRISTFQILPFHAHHVCSHPEVQLRTFSTGGPEEHSSQTLTLWQCLSGRVFQTFFCPSALHR